MESKVMYYEKDRPEQGKWGGERKKRNMRRKRT